MRELTRVLVSRPRGLGRRLLHEVVTLDCERRDTLRPCLVPALAEGLLGRAKDATITSCRRAVLTVLAGFFERERRARVVVFAEQARASHLFLHVLLPLGGPVPETPLVERVRHGLLWARKDEIHAVCRWSNK